MLEFWISSPMMWVIISWVDMLRNKEVVVNKSCHVSDECSRKSFLSMQVLWKEKRMKVTYCLILFLWNKMLFTANLTPWYKGLGCNTTSWCGRHLRQVILKSFNAWQCYSLETNVYLQTLLMSIITFKLLEWPWPWR
jgi:hypothetical protein